MRPSISESNLSEDSVNLDLNGVDKCVADARSFALAANISSSLSFNKPANLVRIEAL